MLGWCQLFHNSLSISRKLHTVLVCYNNELQRQGLYRQGYALRTSVHSNYSLEPNHEIREGGHGLTALEAQKFIESVSRHRMNHTRVEAPDIY